MLRSRNTAELNLCRSHSRCSASLAVPAGNVSVSFPLRFVCFTTMADVAVTGYNESARTAAERKERNNEQYSTLEPNKVSEWFKPMFPGKAIPHGVAAALASVGTAFMTRLAERAREIAKKQGNVTGSIPPECYEAAYEAMEADGEVPAPPIGAAAAASDAGMLFR